MHLETKIPHSNELIAEFKTCTYIG